MPILDANTLEIFSRSPEQTRRIGMRLGGFVKTGDVICLQGELGAGKTTLVQGIAQGWGSLDAVSSPTFVLINIYQRPDSTSLFHLDSYRIESINEAVELDLEDMLVQGPMLIEWPERIKPILPEEHLWVQLNYQDDEQRSMLFSPHGARYLNLMDDFRLSVFGVI